MKMFRIDSTGVPITPPSDVSTIIKELGVSAPANQQLRIEYLKSIGYQESLPEEIPPIPANLTGKCRIVLGLPKRNLDETYSRTYKFEEIEPEELNVIEIRVRARRANILKTLVDPINAVKWAAMSPEKQQEWVIFRAALLDITTQQGWPANVKWPKLPD